MEIIYLGHSCFKLKGKEKSVICDPFDPRMLNIRLPKQECDIVTISHEHQDHNFLDNVACLRVVRDPGEYEIGGVSIVGFSSFHDNEKGEKRGKNTIYLIEIDGVRVLHLGDLGHILTDSLVSEIGVVDVLMVPVGGEFTIGPKEASEVVTKIGAKRVIPMHYKALGISDMFSKLSDLSDFFKLTGLKVENLAKLSIKANEENGDEQIIYALEKK
ncbi:MAG: MBL fold metallo-hydrolase [Candidatus Woesebacteria bacterium]|nr:MAG: MBL fold metallo-hydrolase [Candidatus Woesebacteria bacterium]